MITRFVRRLHVLIIAIILSLALPVTPTSVYGAELESKTGKQWEYIEWGLENPTYSGNPYDVIASVTFTHEGSSETRTTEMFYAGDTTWKFRFTGTRTGDWRFVTSSDDDDLDARRGDVTITANDNENLKGFITTQGDKWIASARDEAFVPRFVMAPSPENTNAGQIDSDIQTFLGDHGFNGFHVQVYCRWFEFGEDECRNVNDSNPDQRTFEALETLIRKTHAAGGAVHLWMYGDNSRNQNPKSRGWALNGSEDRRIQRYIAARLGPLPGWSMGYGYDLNEWANGQDVAQWHNYLTDRMGWSHPLGARANKNQLNQLTEVLDYASYEQVRPDYDQFVAAITARPSKPTFSEDRFRILSDTSSSRYFSPRQIRRMLWQTAMSGGVAAIWGNLEDGRPSARGSASFPNAAQLKTLARFIDPRFTQDVVRCTDLTNGTCLRRPTNDHYLFYKEDTDRVEMDLSGMDGAQRAIAIDTTRAYQVIDLGRLDPADQTWEAPTTSDWAIAVGDFGQNGDNGDGGGSDPSNAATLVDEASLRVESGKPYTFGALTNGADVYVDRDYTWRNIPGSLNGAIAIVTANNDKSRSDDGFLRFELTAPAVVAVVHDIRVDPRPSWLADWEETDITLRNTDPGDPSMRVYTKQFPAGQVTIGGNVAERANQISMYAVLIYTD